MGVNLTPIIIKKRILALKDLAGKTLAIDANNALHQFLSITRMADGSPFTDGHGNVTSHLIGLLFRSTRLVSEFTIKPVFVFDGEPPTLKRREIEKRRAMRAKAESEMAEALRRGDLHTAFSKAVMTGRLTREIIDDAKRLLHFLGIPYVQAPSEAEAQAAYMASQGNVWAANSQDYDSILFGTPRLVRYITIQGKEYLPSTGKARPLKPELIEAKDLLASLGVSKEQIIDIAILIGTDFNEGVRGVGPKTALKLIREKGRVENLPDTIRSRVPENFQEVRELFLNPKVTRDFPTTFGPLREKELLDFLCIQKNFSRNRVALAVDRMKKPTSQSILPQWAEKN